MACVQVIYALNTKNDENEAVLQALRDQHEEEKQQLLADMQSKIQQFKWVQPAPLLALFWLSFFVFLGL